ncbi:TonB family protein [Kangiella marina]|uniref:Protein TonB n=1 Tax=Kangiella marina TaxID=1079178 RepID=A0ABP8IEG2_9GAMM
MLSDLKFNGWLDAFWQFNLDLSVIVLTVLVVRFFIRKTTKSYNSYLLWLAIPLGFVVAKVIASIDFSSANSSYIGQAVSVMIIKPVETLQNYWWLGALWLSGTTLLLLRLIIQHIELRKNLKDIRRPLDDLPGAELFKARRYQVIAVEHKDMSPAVYGFIKPTIYFPTHIAKQLSVQQIQLIIEHEEQHIKQKHLWLNLLWDVLVCVGWFNPLIYIARKNFRHDQELFCDYLVLNKTSESRTKDYGHALLSTVSATHSVSLLCSWKVFNQLEERIMNITKPINRKGKVTMTLGAMLALSCCAVYAANKEVKHSPEKHIVVSENVTVDENRHAQFVVQYDNDDALYIQENDKFYIEEDGKRREMTEAERVDFERKHEEAMKELALSEDELIQIEKEIEDAHKVLELHADEIELAQVEMESAREEIAKAQQEIQLEFEKGNLSKEEMHRYKEDLHRAKEQLARDRENIRVDIERARQDLEQAKKDVHEQRIYQRSRAPGNDSHRTVVVSENIIKNGSSRTTDIIKLVDDNGKTYIKSNGQYSIEVDGKEREMTSEEKAFFDKKFKAIPHPPKPPKAANAPTRVRASERVMTRIPPMPPKAANAPTRVRASERVMTRTPPMPPKASSPVEPIHQPRASYPKAAVEQNIEGYVDLTFDINDSGKASNIQVTESSDNGLFNKDAIDAVKQWEFAEKDYGKKGMKYKMKFDLDSKDLSL